MDVLTVTKLLDAGFSADEIRKMEADPETKPADPETKPADPETKPADPETKPADPAQEPAYLTALNDTMNKILTAIQAGNVARNTVPAINNPADIDAQVDKIMAGIIRPEHEKGEK